jgi:hypothetical protein
MRYARKAQLMSARVLSMPRLPLSGAAVMTLARLSARKRSENYGDSMCHGLLLEVRTHAANHHEVTLLLLRFDFYMIEARHKNLIGDRAYDSAKLNEQLCDDRFEMISPQRSHRKKSRTQDGRRLCCHERRRLVECFFSLAAMETLPLDSPGTLRSLP